MYFDSHAHLTEDCFAQDFDTIVENMKAASVTGMTTPRRWTRRGSPSTASCVKTRA